MEPNPVPITTTPDDIKSGNLKCSLSLTTHATPNCVVREQTHADSLQLQDTDARS